MNATTPDLSFYRSFDRLMQFVIRTDGSPIEQTEQQREAWNTTNTLFLRLIAECGETARVRHPTRRGVGLIHAVGDELAERIAPGSATPLLQFVCGEAVRCQVVTEKRNWLDDEGAQCIPDDELENYLDADQPPS